MEVSRIRREELFNEHVGMIDEYWFIPNSYKYSYDVLEDFKQECRIHLFKSVVHKLDGKEYTERQAKSYVLVSLRRKLWKVIGKYNSNHSKFINFSSYFDFYIDECADMQDFNSLNPEDYVINEELISEAYGMLSRLRDADITIDIVFNGMSAREVGTKYGKDKATIAKINEKNIGILQSFVKK